MIASWRSILALVVFFLTNIVGVFPFKVPIPLSTPVFDAFAAKAAVFLRVCLPSDSCCKDHPRILTQTSREGEKRPAVIWKKITVGFQTAPLIAVLLLLATGVLHGKEIREGITGTSGVEPLDIMALFISLAYLAISLDTTGLFRFLAFWVVRKGGSSGRRLYLYLYSFFFAAGILVGNDPVVLFGTPFLAYFSRASGLVPPTAWVFAQFVVANTAAAVLPSANLTNLVLTGAFSFSFISYAAHAVLPTLATGVALYPLLAFVLFKSQEYVPRQIDVVELQHPHSETGSVSSAHPPDALTDKKGAIFGSVLLGVTLAVLVGTSPLKVPVWMVTVPPALIMIARDIWHDRHLWKRNPGSSSHPEPVESIPMELAGSSKCCKTDKNVAEKVAEYTPAENKARTLGSFYQDIRKGTLPTLFSILPRLPTSLVLFAFCMFILVQALTTWGWVEVFAAWWSAWITACLKVGTGFATVGAVYLMLIISTFLCNICGTNIGTTILLARVLQSWLANAPAPVDPKIRLGAIYALALGSNFGAYTFSFSASLAGLLWRDILRQKGIAVSQRQFAWFNLPTIAVAVLVSGAVLIAEVYVVAR